MNSSGAGPSSAATAAAVAQRSEGAEGTGRSDLWSEILRSADRGRGRGGWRRKNVLLLSERHHGRRYLLDQLLAAPASSRRKAKASSRPGRAGCLAMGYEVLDVKEEGDEDSAPPVSIFYPPSSHPSMTRLIPHSLPPESLSDTAVVILLDWTKPSSMIRELQTWLAWVDNWAAASAQHGEAEELREKLQSHWQHYAEPAPPVSTAISSTSPYSTPALPSIASAFHGGPLLPLGQGTLTLNWSGIPIVVVCTKADLMHTAGDEIGMKGGGWEERTDWVQQVLRTICLAYGASLFYTAASQPTTFTLLRSYLLHRLYTIPPSLALSSEAPPAPTSAPSRFPFPHRANVLDRDAVMVPAGWDSWGKINVLRDGFDPGRVGKAWEASMRRVNDGDTADEDEGLEDLWLEMIPDTEKSVKPSNQHHIAATEPEQSFLSRQLDILLKDPNRDPRATFRNAANLTAASSSAPGATDTQAGVVGPMGSGGLNLPGVEKAMLEMEGGSAEDLREKFARLGRRESSRPSPLSPTGTAPGGGAPTVPNEALHNFFQGLLATKGKTGSSTPKPADSKSGNTARSSSPKPET